MYYLNLYTVIMEIIAMNVTFEMQQKCTELILQTLTFLSFTEKNSWSTLVISCAATKLLP